MSEIFFCAPDTIESLRVAGMLLELGVRVRWMTGRETIAAIAGGSLPELLVVSTGIHPLNASDLLAELSRFPAVPPMMVLAERDDVASLFVVALERAGTTVLCHPVEEERLLNLLLRTPGLMGARARLRLTQACGAPRS